MVVLIAVSLATGEPSKEIQDEFDAVREGKCFLAAEQKKCALCSHYLRDEAGAFFSAECIEKKEKKNYNAH